jgi:transposase
MRAAELFGRGRRPAEVARELGVSIQSASEWYRRWSAGGKQALRAAGRAGRLPRLDADQLARVEHALLQGPTANGFPTELWTLPRVADVIERVTGWPITPGTCGGSCGSSWGGVASGPLAGRPNATTPPSPSG